MSSTAETVAAETCLESDKIQSSKLVASTPTHMKKLFLKKTDGICILCLNCLHSKSEGLNEGLDESFDEGLAEGLDEGLGECLNECLDEGLVRGLVEDLDKGLGEGLDKV